MHTVLFLSLQQILLALRVEEMDQVQMCIRDSGYTGAERSPPASCGIFSEIHPRGGKQHAWKRTSIQ